MIVLLIGTLPLTFGAPPSAADSASCPDSSEAIASSTYIEGRGCVVEDIADYCDRAYSGPCPTWAQTQARYGADADRLLTCDDGGTVAYRNVYDATSWYLQEDFDHTGRLIGALTYSYGDTDDPYCCDGVTSGVLRWGDSDGVCTPVEPHDTGEADSADTGADTGRADSSDPAKAGPCGCSSNSAAAVALLSAITLGATRRRRQP